MGSVLTSHLRATCDAAVKESVETDVSDSCKLKLALRACTSAFHSCVRRESRREGEPSRVLGDGPCHEVVITCASYK